MKHLITLVACVLLAQAQDSVRVDLFDRHSQRQGYLVIDRKAGRVDSFDNDSRRQGCGTITTPSSGGTRVDTFAPGGARTGSRTTATTPRR